MRWRRQRISVHLLLIYLGTVIVSLILAGRPASPSFDRDVVPAFGEQGDTEPAVPRAGGRKLPTLESLTEALPLSSDLYRSLLATGIPGLGLSADERQDELSWMQLAERIVYILTDVRLSEPFSYLRTAYPMLSLVLPPGPGTQPTYIVHLPESPPEDRKPPPGTEPTDDEPPAEAADLWLGMKEPRVMIYHTHTQESYWNAVIEATGNPDPRDAFIADDQYNVLRVGAELADELHQQYGVAVIHVQEYFDTLAGGTGMNRVGSYARSADKIAPLLQQYPTVTVLLDIHRDSTPRELTAFQSDSGQTWARVMIVLGTDKHLEHPLWRLNAQFAEDMARTMEAEYPGLFLKTLVSDYRYNQHLLPGALLLEVGGIENTLEEALLSARNLARVIAILLRDGKVPKRP
ncbi:MAG: stage II sporulation protein P [Bacillota bacterium]